MPRLPACPVSAIGRVYMTPEPDHGPHPGYRGRIDLSPVGVHIDTDCDYLDIDIDDIDPLRWPDSRWKPVGTACLLPWHRVYLIEWGNRFAASTARPMERSPALTEQGRGS